MVCMCYGTYSNNYMCGRHGMKATIKIHTGPCVSVVPLCSSSHSKASGSSSYFPFGSLKGMKGEAATSWSASEV